MHGILTIITCMIRFCLQSLHRRYLAWTKPATTSLLLGTLTDLSRSKSELVAENALLRQQLIILRRQVKRPACTKTDRMLLELQTLVEVQVQGSLSQAKDLPGDRDLDPGNGK